MPRHSKSKFRTIQKRFEAVLRRAGKAEQRWPYETEDAAINTAERHLVRYAEEDGADDAEVIEKTKAGHVTVWPKLN